MHHHVSLNLSCMDAGEPQQFASRVDVAPGCQRHGGEGVTANGGT